MTGRVNLGQLRAQLYYTNLMGTFVLNNNVKVFCRSEVKHNSMCVRRGNYFAFLYVMGLAYVVFLGTLRWLVKEMAKIR